VDLDEMGPESAKSFAGQRLVRGDPQSQRRARARQEIDYGRRGRGYIFGAFVPATGAALTVPYHRRSTANVVDFLEHVEAWRDPNAERVYAVLDNLSAHRAMDVLLWALVHPHWEFVFQPTYAAYLNLIEPWWKTLRSLALKGRRFETWDQIVTAVADEHQQAFGIAPGQDIFGNQKIEKLGRFVGRGRREMFLNFQFLNVQISQNNQQ
jgi:hypothetical protein